MPHPTIPSRGLAKPMSRAMSVLLASDDVIVENWCLHENQPTGPLRNFLTQQYANAGEVEQAFTDAGGSVVVRATSGASPNQTAFLTDARGFPVLVFRGQRPPTFCEVRILLAESARA